MDQVASRGKKPRRARNPRTPSWLLAFSVGAVLLTLGFFMVLLVLSVFGHEVPARSRFLVVVVLALGAAMGTAGLGGYAALEGMLPVEASDKNALSISATGGVAVLIAVLLLGPTIVPADNDDPPTLDLHLDTLAGKIVGEQPARVQIDARFRSLSVQVGTRLSLMLGNTATCEPSTYRAIVDDPRQGQMTVFLRRGRSELSCARLVVTNPAGGVIQAGPVETIRWEDK